MGRTARRFALTALVLLAVCAALASAQAGSGPDLPPAGAGEIEQWAGGQLREVTSRLSSDASAVLWLRLLPFALLYGIVHTALLGPRKLLLVSYFLAEDARPVQGLVAGAAVAVLQVGLAAAVILLSGTGLERPTAWLGRASGIIAAAVGIVVLVLRAVEYFRTRGDWIEQKYISKLLPVDKRIDPDNEDPAVQLAVAHARKLRRRRRMDAPWLPAIILAGGVPSPGAAAALSFSIETGVPLAAFAAVALVAVGTAVVLAIISVVTIVAKERLVDVLSSRAAHFTHLSLEVAGGAMLVVLGFLFFS
jgi:ABC-type nickel/cobalt efflux system permease component RcnA